MKDYLIFYIKQPFYKLLKEGKITVIYREINNYHCARICARYGHLDEACATCRYNYCAIEPKANTAIIKLSGSPQIKEERQFTMAIKGIRKGYAPFLFRTSCYRQMIIDLQVNNLTAANLDYEKDNF